LECGDLSPLWYAAAWRRSSVKVMVATSRDL
jgi:hypothetical protein